jgi:zinc protease
MDLRSEVMEEHYRKYYVPSNATLVVVGDFNSDEVLQRVEHLFGSLPAVARPPAPEYPMPEWNSHVRLDLTKASMVPRVLLAFPVPPMKAGKIHLVDLLEKLLVGGKLSRLHRVLVEKHRIASLVTMEGTETFDPYLIHLRMELRDSDAMDEAEGLVLEELSRLAEEGPTESELDRARNQCLTEYFSDSETTFDLALQYGLFHILDEVESYERHPKLLINAAPESIADAAGRFLSRDRYAICRSARGAS